MFGYWFNRRLYENLPQFLFFAGIAILVISAGVPGLVSASLIAVSGLALICAAWSAIVMRNKYRVRAFRFSQLIFFKSAASLPDRRRN